MFSHHEGVAVTSGERRTLEHPSESHTGVSSGSARCLSVCQVARAVEVTRMRRQTDDVQLVKFCFILYSARQVYQHPHSTASSSK